MPAPEEGLDLLKALAENPLLRAAPDERPTLRAPGYYLIEKTACDRVRFAVFSRKRRRWRPLGVAVRPLYNSAE